MRFLLRWSWPFLAFSVLFEAYSYQIFYNSLSGVSLLANLAFSLAIFVGDLPAILIVTAIVVGIYWACVRVVSMRLFAVSFGIGCLTTAIIIRPLILAYYTH